MTERQKSFFRSLFPIFGYFLLFLVVCVVVYRFWLDYPHWYLTHFPNSNETPSDNFGGLGALFSGFALAGVIITLWMQGHELRLQRQEMNETQELMKEQRIEMERARKESVQPFLVPFFVASFSVIKVLRDKPTAPIQSYAGIVYDLTIKNFTEPTAINLEIEIAATYKDETGQTIELENKRIISPFLIMNDPLGKERHPEFNSSWDLLDCDKFIRQQWSEGDNKPQSAIEVRIDVRYSNYLGQQFRVTRCYRSLASDYDNWIVNQANETLRKCITDVETRSQDARAVFPVQNFSSGTTGSLLTFVEAVEGFSMAPVIVERASQTLKAHP